ncbi:hypothetical protein R3P38DRAFT_2904415 [Favolaschia claudopus]|uniref:F-box domain-containing protein n=1 Tax=Favolaschia claudopus TaxID=2862362 RepID=A0AAW0CEH7_9AGAR
MSIALNESTTASSAWPSNLSNVQVESQVKALIATTEANIERLGVQIRELDALRQKELSLLATLRRMITGTPIGRLPTELLVEIFRLAVQTPVLCKPPSEWLYEENCTSALRKVLCLAHVSPYWRQIIHQTPRLWAEAVVDFRFDREQASYISGLEAMLNRSAPHSISVYLRAGGRRWSKVVPRVISQTAPRWKNLQTNFDDFPHFNGLPAEKFAHLEKLHVVNLWSQDSPVTVFRSSPLTHFTLRCAMGTVKLFHLAWEGLTHIEIRDPSMSGCRSVLLQCHNLVVATIHTSMEWDIDQSSVVSPIVTLPFFESLDLTVWDCEFGDTDGLEAFFGPLALPSLKTLDIESHHDEVETWPTEVFLEFLDRATKLQWMKLSYSSIEAEGLVSLLRHTPALKTLKLFACWNSMQSDAFWNALRYHESDSSPLVPKLERILFDFVGEIIGEDAFLEAIRSRWWKEDGRVLADGSLPRVSRLKELYVSPSDMEEYMMSISLKARIQELVGEGLNMNVRVGFRSGTPQ